MFDWSDPQTLWLNITNLALGLVTLAAVLGVGYACCKEVLERRLLKKHASHGAHAYFDPELGLTMADGGEPDERPPQPKR